MAHSGQMVCEQITERKSVGETMKKVAFIYLSNYSEWPMGGMLTYVKNIIPFLSEQDDWKMDLWGGTVNHFKPEPFSCNGHNISINIYTNIKTQKKIVPNFVRSFFGVLFNRKQFKKYDIVYSHTSATTIAMKIIYPRKYVVHHQHGLSYKNNKEISRILNLGYTLAQLVANITFFVASETEVNEHKKNALFVKKRFYHMGSPINYKDIINVPSDKNHKQLNFIYTGRIDKWKNIDLLIDSFLLFSQKYQKPCKLTLIGDGPEFMRISQKINQIHAEQMIYLEGCKDFEDIVKELKKSDFFLFPSKGEGVSLSILEALAAGVPVIAFDVVGVRNLIKNNATGILVRQMTKEAFAEGICSAVHNTNLTSEKCIQSVQLYDAESISKQIFSTISDEYHLYTIRENGL